MLLPASRLLYAASALFFVVACAGGTFAPSSVADGARKQNVFVSAAAGPERLRLYVADEQKNEILIFDVPGTKPVAIISDRIDRPQGLALDDKGTLYVANSGNDTITVYPLYHGAPSLRYSRGVHDPAGIVVDVYGNLYYTDTSGAVREITRGTGTAKLVTSKVKNPIGVTAAPYGLEAESELYVAEPTSGDVVLVAPNSQPPIAVRSPGPGVYGVVYAQDGALYVSTSRAPAGVYVYAKPTAKTAALAIHHGLMKPQWMALTSDRELFVDDGASKRVFAFARGATEPSLTFADVGVPTGLAVGSVRPTPVPSSTPTPQATATPTLPPTPTPGPLSVTPKTLTFASASPQTFVAKEDGYDGQITATSSNKRVAMVSPGKGIGSGPTFTVTPLAYGNCTIEVSDKKGNKAVVTVIVNNGIIIINALTPASTRGDR